MRVVVHYNDSIEFFYIFCFCIAFKGIFSWNGIIYVRPQNTVTSSFLHTQNFEIMNKIPKKVAKKRHASRVSNFQANMHLVRIGFFFRMWTRRFSLTRIFHRSRIFHWPRIFHRPRIFHTPRFPLTPHFPTPRTPHFPP